MRDYDDDFFEEDKIRPNSFLGSKKSDTKTEHTSHLLFSVDIDCKDEGFKNKQEKDTSIVEIDNEESSQEKSTSIDIEDVSATECILNDLRQERYQLIYQNLLNAMEPTSSLNQPYWQGPHEWKCSKPHALKNFNWGMTITSGNVTILKDESNLIGISIGGGAPLCPCLYIVQVFDNTPASKEGTLQSGDELVGVNGQCVKGKTKVEVAKMIQSAKEEVNINYNKLHADPKQGKCLDIIMKKVKHRLVENMSTTTADALGLSRAILCNDTLVKKLQELQNTEQMYKGLVEHAKRMLKAYFDLLLTYKNFGDAFASIGVREPQPRASEAFSQFGNFHRQMEKNGIKMLKAVKPILSDMGTYLHKAIPDTKLTIKKYADTKFEYLSYCLKVKEMDDEEYSYNALQEPLYGVETGNYEYRLILRCRQDARNRFARLRSDVLVKMELLDNKHVQDVVWQLHRFITGLATFHDETLEVLKLNGKLFPVEVDLTQNAFQYKSTMSMVQDNEDDDDCIMQEIGKEITEHYEINARKKKKSEIRNGSDHEISASSSLLPDLDDSRDDLENVSENTSLLAELGLTDTSSLLPHSSYSISNLDKSLSDSFFKIDLGEGNSHIDNTDDELVFSEFFSSGMSSGDMKRSDSTNNLLSGLD